MLPAVASATDISWICTDNPHHHHFIMKGLYVYSRNLRAERDNVSQETDTESDPESETESDAQSDAENENDTELAGWEDASESENEQSREGDRESDSESDAESERNAESSRKRWRTSILADGPTEAEEDNIVREVFPF